MVTIDGWRIAAVGKGPAGGGQFEDLGNVAILPGLVNAHTHLEFSNLSEPLGEPGMRFIDWIRRVIEFRLEAPTRGPVAAGLRESLQLGITTLGDIAQPGRPVKQTEDAGPDTTVFLELIAPTAERVAATVELARQHVAAARSSASWHPGLSPHAPYSVHPELLGRAVSLSAAEHVPIAFHLAESPDELELLRSGSGPFRDLLEQLETWNAGTILPNTRPLDYLRTLVNAHRTLIVHGNYLDDEEIAFLADHADRMSVIYCPRTHAYFAHEAYPLQKMLSVGVAVALGTDSRASSPDLSILAETRFVANKYPTVGRDVVLQLGTIRAATALGRDHQLGSLEPGKFANLAIVALPNRNAADPYELLFNSNEPVVATWYRGVKLATSRVAYQ